MTGEPTKTLVLEDRHLARGARMVPFAGYSMPLQFAGITEEHHAVRTAVGIFDVSHMGEIEFRGADAEEAVNHLITNDASRLVDGQALYSAMCNAQGGIVDDLVVYRFAADHFFICVNGARRSADFAHMTAHTSGDVTVTDRSDEFVQLAVQGPKAPDVVAPITDLDLDDLEYYHARWAPVAGVRCLVSRTGYTGEDGFELYIPADDGPTVYDAVMEAGAAHGIQPCGLGARDTLRLEAKYLLYGSDMNESTNPIEAGLGWVVKLDKPDGFVGADAVRAVKEQGVSRRMRGLVLVGRGVLRPHYELFVGDDRVGELTSGTYSPTLGKSIGLGWVAVEHANDEKVHVDIRGRRLVVELTKKPFYKRDA